MFEYIFTFDAFVVKQSKIKSTVIDGKILGLN